MPIGDRQAVLVPVTRQGPFPGAGWFKASEAEQKPAEAPSMFVVRRAPLPTVYLCNSWSEREGLQLGLKSIPGPKRLHQ